MPFGAQLCWWCVHTTCGSARPAASQALTVQCCDAEKQKHTTKQGNTKRTAGPERLWIQTDTCLSTQTPHLQNHPPSSQQRQNLPIPLNANNPSPCVPHACPHCLERVITCCHNSTPLPPNTLHLVCAHTDNATTCCCLPRAPKSSRAHARHRQQESNAANTSAIHSTGLARQGHSAALSRQCPVACQERPCRITHTRHKKQQRETTATTSAIYSTAAWRHLARQAPAVQHFPVCACGNRLTWHVSDIRPCPIYDSVTAAPHVSKCTACTSVHPRGVSHECVPTTMQPLLATKGASGGPSVCAHPPRQHQQRMLPMLINCQLSERLVKTRPS